MTTASNTIPLWILFSVLSYLIASVPFGKLISRRVADIDITRRGSGNIGATNVARELGLGWGVVTLFLDLLKGFIPTYSVQYLLPYSEMGMAAVALSALLGHQFSLFLRFHGGKGVATALGIFLAISPVACLLSLLAFILTVYLSDFVSLGSMIAALIMPLWLLILQKGNGLILCSILMAGLICIQHRDNVKRLVRGEERRWRKPRLTSNAQEDDPAPHRNRSV